MPATTKALLVLLLVLTASWAGAQAAAKWEIIHGTVQSVQAGQMTFKTDDGRVLNVDMSQVSQTVQKAMQPNLGAKLAGFAGDQPNKFTARFIEQDNAGRASGTPAATTMTDKIAQLIPQFVGDKEFLDLQAALPSNPASAQLFITQLYQGILKRAPTAKERSDWVSFLMQTKDPRSVTEFFVRSQEYTQRTKTDQQAIRDLYEGLYGRAPSADEVRTWQQRLAQR
jgi:hypothetical protein